MPVAGVSDPSASQLKFEWLSIRVLYTLFITVCFFALAIVSLIWIFVNDLSLPVIGKLLFKFINFSHSNEIPLFLSASEPFVWFLTKCVAIIYFLRMGKRWPQLMLQWEMVEKRSPTYTKKKKNYKFVKKIRAFAVIMLIVIHSK